MTFEPLHGKQQTERQTAPLSPPGPVCLPPDHSALPNRSPVDVTVSIIIPVWREQERITPLLQHLAQLDPAISREIIVVDGDPGGSTLAAITNSQVCGMLAPKGRGQQLATGATAASGDIILLLHADTLLPDNALSSVLQAVQQGATWGAFRLGIAATGPAYRLLERSVDLRCKLFSLPYGDQAVFVQRTVLADLGGIPPIPLMEDVELARRLVRAHQRFVLLPHRVCTSARRWQRDGILLRSLKNLLLLFSYLTGTSPKKLANRY